MIFLVSSGFSLGTLPWMPFLPSLCLLVESWALTLIEASDACSSLDVVLGSFMTSDESSLRSWSNFGRPATPGKVHHCYKFSPFVDNGSDRGSLQSQSLRLYIPFQTDTCQLFCLFCFVSTIICSWISLDCGMRCCSLSMLHFVRQVLFKWFLDSTGLAVIRPGCV